MSSYARPFIGKRSFPPGVLSTFNNYSVDANSLAPFAEAFADVFSLPPPSPLPSPPLSPTDKFPMNADGFVDFDAMSNGQLQTYFNRLCVSFANMDMSADGVWLSRSNGKEGPRELASKHNMIEQIIALDDNMIRYWCLAKDYFTKPKSVSYTHLTLPTILLV